MMTTASVPNGRVFRLRESNRIRMQEVGGAQSVSILDNSILLSFSLSSPIREELSDIVWLDVSRNFPRCPGANAARLASFSDAQRCA